jgi:hypothetical protein
MALHHLRGRRCDRGSSTIEMAILWPAIVATLFGAIQTACYFTARTVALTAAQAAVTAERQLGTTEEVGIGHAEELIAQSGDWLRDAMVRPPDYSDDGFSVSYTVQGRALSLVPWLTTWEISQTAHGTLEQWTEAVP